MQNSNQVKRTFRMALGRLVMVASTVLMGGALIMAGNIMGASGTGLFGVSVGLLEQSVGATMVFSGVALLPLALLMLRRQAKWFVIAALMIVAVDLVAFVLVERGAGPMFALVYAVVLGAAYKISR